MKQEKQATTETASALVLSFINALNKEEFDLARSYVNDDFTFNGVLGSRHGADNYFEDMRKMKFRYMVKKVFAEESDVCLFYNITIAGVSIFASGWYQLKDQKLSSLTVLFDPRPVLDGSAKQ